MIDELKEGISEVYLRLPTFQVRSDLDVVESLKKLGAKKAFEAGAELTELGTGQLSVSKISHTALLEVSILVLLILILITIIDISSSIKFTKPNFYSMHE